MAAWAQTQPKTAGIYEIVPTCDFLLRSSHGTIPGGAKRLADEFFSEENKSRAHQALRTFVAMVNVLNVKFASGTLARKRLQQTGDLELIHLSGSDFFWGQNRKGEGKNLLGKALMQIRNSGSDCSVLEMVSNAGE